VPWIDVSVSEAWRLKELKSENSRLKQMLDNVALKKVPSKTWYIPPAIVNPSSVNHFGPYASYLYEKEFIMITRIVIAALALTLAGCRHPIEIIGQGDVLSATGDRDCLLEDFQAGKKNCSKNNVTTSYQETYFAVPRKGWQFGGWGTYCSYGVPTDQCSFNVSDEAINEFSLEEVPPLTAYFRREVTAGHKALLMGHSFFEPFSARLPEYAASAGFDDHIQDKFFSGGGGGAPSAFWNDTGSENNVGIKQVLDVGGITLFGMTYYPNPDRENNLQGYKNWIDYALKNNDNFTVFIGAPWNLNPATIPAQKYKKDWLEFETAEIHDFIDQLRDAYPSLAFYCIPYGLGASELRIKLATGKLPDIESLNPSAGPGDWIYSDDLGHASDMLTRLGSLIWLKAIYGVDLNEYNYDHPYSVNLKAMATKILNQHNHHYDAP
jgi:hypothetical protein